MTRCAECGHAYFTPWRSRGHPSGLCAVCRLRKDGGLGLVRIPAQAPRPSPPGDGWVALRDVAPLLGLKPTTLQTPPWLAKLGAIKIGRAWWVARTALDALKD